MFETIDWVMLIGQALGVVAVILGFVTYQMKSPKALLIVNLITCGVFCLHYLLIGAISGAVMNGLGILRNVVYTNRDKKIFSSPAWPFIWSAIMLVAGLVTWQDWRSVLMVCALVINSAALSMKNAQHIRWSLLIIRRYVHCVGCHRHCPFPQNGSGNQINKRVCCFYNRPVNYC